MESVAYEELLQKDGRVMTHVVGSSMLPLLHDRESIVIVEAADQIQPVTGDVVLYRTGGRYILHRIVKILPKEYLIRGDNTWQIEHVPKENLLAVMTGFYRRPESNLITGDNAGYRLYCLALPCIRWGRRIMGKAKRLIHNLPGMAKKIMNGKGRI